MLSTYPDKLVFSHGYPAALSELQSAACNIEPDCNLGLYALLHASGIGVDYCEADVLCGHATQFIYSREQPECAQLAFVPPVDTLFRALGIAWKEVTPSGADAAFAVFKEWISAGRLCYARLREPLLVFGFGENYLFSVLAIARVWNRLAKETVSLADCESRFWRFPIDEGNLLISIEDAPKAPVDWKELAIPVIRRAARSWYSLDLAGCASGEAAYLQLASDLRDPDVDFMQEKSRPWMGAALWRQWTSRRSLHRFFERIAPRFGGAERNAVAKAAFCYGRCVEAWQEWANQLGPHWNYEHNGFESVYPAEFVALWRNRDLRNKASVQVDEARGWEDKAIAELTKLIH